MLNRKKLIQISLSEIPSETEYLDYKQKINLFSDSGRAKIIRLICAMNNSNPKSMSFIFVGIGDNKELVGASFFDDADFQNAIKDFLPDFLKLSYENVKFPGLPEGRFIGVITIYPSQAGSSICKDIWKLRKGDKFFRRGSITERSAGPRNRSIKNNQFESEQLVKRATVSLGSTLDTFLKFYKETSESYNPEHYVFNDQYVVGITQWRDDSSNLSSEATVTLLNEEVSFFWSALEYVKITCTRQQVVVEEHALVFWNGERRYMPIKSLIIDFSSPESYSVDKSVVARIPSLSQADIENFMSQYQCKIKSDENYLEIFPYELLLAALNGSTEAAFLLLNRNEGKVDGSLAESYAQAIKTYTLLCDPAKNLKQLEPSDDSVALK